MSYATPFTAVAGTPWKASDWNVYGRDNIAWIATDSPACRAYNSAAISVANATDVFLTFNSERFDNASVHSTSSNTGRLTVPTGGGGKYIIGSNIDYATTFTGVLRASGLRLNGSTYIADQYAPPINSAFSSGRFTVTAIYSLSAADYVEVRAYQDSGGALNVTATGNYSPEFWCFWFRN
jgi:hypothetical protein